MVPKLTLTLLDSMSKSKAKLPKLYVLKSASKLSEVELMLIDLKTLLTMFLMSSVNSNSEEVFEPDVNELKSKLTTELTILIMLETSKPSSNSELTLLSTESKSTSEISIDVVFSPTKLTKTFSLSKYNSKLAVTLS